MSFSSWRTQLCCNELIATARILIFCVLLHSLKCLDISVTGSSPSYWAAEAGESVSSDHGEHRRREDSGEGRSEAEAGQACDPTRCCGLDTCCQFLYTSFVHFHWWSLLHVSPLPKNNWVYHLCVYVRGLSGSVPAYWGGGDNMAAQFLCHFSGLNLVFIA
jgi:hypothetical protein